MKRLLVAGCCVAAAAMSLVAQQAPGQQPARDTSAKPATITAPATARISGRVVAGDTGRAVKRARVFISAAELPGGRAMLTDDMGAFDFTELPAGRYSINASKSGYIQLSYGQRRPLMAGTPIQLLDGQQLRGIDFALPKGGVISGRVTDESGDAMPGVMVQILRYQYQQGDRRLAPSGQAQSDDRGVYRVWGLNPGDYYVSATARNEGLGGRGNIAQLAQIAQDAIAAAGRGGGRGGRGGAIAFASAQDDQDQLMYAPTYYPGVDTPAEARAVTVGVSQEVTDIDFGLHLVRTSRVSGHVENPDGSWTMQGNVQLSPQATQRGNFGQNYGGRIGWDGQFSIANVPPGTYTLRARNQDRDSPLSASQPVGVSGGDVTNVVVVLQNGASFSGSLMFQPGSTPVPTDLTQIRVTAPAADPDDNIGPQSNARVNKDGTFTLDGVTPGSHLIRANGQLRGWNLKSVEVNGRDVTDTPIDVRSNQKITSVVLTFTDKTSEIDGTVTDAQGQPVTEYTVLAFSTNNAHWRQQSRQIATARPDQTGMFKIRYLPAGEYYVVTVDPAEQGEWFDPQYLDQHRTGAARLTLADGAVANQDFKVNR
ncbi:MAG TPA: carboxypeptidase-like regulatory domain-containing protein [Vicinamibacterales bacterium]|nr:carboxypeptidase-like regulatory domain-containing protein [Vicinamibacterales bacterium]